MAAQALVALALLLLISGSHACVYTYGNRDEAAHLAGGHYDYGYNGLNWASSFPDCRGQKQSPVLLPGTGAAAKSLSAPAGKSTFSYGSVNNAVVLNNGHTLQVPLPAGFQSDVQIPVKGDTSTAKGTSVLQSSASGNISYVKASPAQLHFHTHSEHVISGAVYPMELHIVHFIKKDQLPACGDAGCPVVLGMMIALTRNESMVSQSLRKIVEAMPLTEGTNATINGTLNVGALLPKNRKYFTYEGSLTTPPCSEGILWHILTTPIYITQELLTRYQEAVGNYNCPDAASHNSTGGVTAADGPSDNAASGNSKNANAAKVTKEKAKRNDDSDDEEEDFALPPADAKGCVKLADGHNYRVAQPLNNRQIMLSA